MSNDFRVEIGFVNHPKLKRLRRRIGDRAAEHLLCLWSFATLNRPTGDMSGMTDEEIADAAGFESDASSILTALRDTKWIDGEQGNYRLHDWAEHQRWVIHAPKRSESARKAAEERWNKRQRQQKQQVNAKRMPDACGEHTESIADAPKSSQKQDSSSQKQDSTYKSGKMPSEENQELNADRNAPSPSPSPDSDQKHHKQQQGPGLKKGGGDSPVNRFVPPSVVQVTEYCQARRNNVNPEKFHAFYTSNGWKVGKNPMRNWKAAIIASWEKDEITETKPAVDCVGRELKSHKPTDPIDFSDPVQFEMVKALDNAGVNTDRLDTLQALTIAYDNYKHAVNPKEREAQL